MQPLAEFIRLVVPWHAGQGNWKYPIKKKRVVGGFYQVFARHKVSGQAGLIADIRLLTFSVADVSLLSTLPGVQAVEVANLRSNSTTICVFVNPGLKFVIQRTGAPFINQTPKHG